MSTFIGRTITGLEPPDTQNDYQWLLRLDDGTAVEFAVRDYGDDVAVTHLTPEVLQQRALDREAERLAREEGLRRRKQMRGELAPEAFEKWRRETYPTTTEVIRDAWTSVPIVEQFAAPSMLSRLVPPT